MGASQSYISSEAALTAAALAGAVALGYYQMSGQPGDEPAPTRPTAPVTKEKKGKKGKAGAPAQSQPVPASMPVVPNPVVAPFPAIIPGEFDASPAPGADTLAPKPKKNKKKKGAKASAVADSDTASLSASGSQLRVPAAPVATQKQSKKPSQQQASHARELSAAAIDTDGSWTRVESRRKDNASASVGESSHSAAADVTTSDAPSSHIPDVTDEEDEEAVVSERMPGENRRTLAEKLLPKPRKTGVDDMVETPDYPTLARVMRVAPRAGEQPAAGFSWGDYEDVRAGHDADGEDTNDDEDGGGWGVVRSRKAKPARPAGSVAPAAGSGSGTATPETKKQRQNQRKREAEKAARADAEAQRLQTLSRHQRELERSRIAEQYASKSGPGGKVGGGMAATVDSSGRLVWE